MQNKAVKYIVKIGLVLSVLLVTTIASAQSRFEMAVRGGASMLMYSTEYGKMQPSYNFGVDLLYNYRSPNVVGFRGGVSFDFAESRFVANDYADSYDIVDDQNDKLNITYTIGNLEEAHRQIYASVPLQLGIHAGNFAIFIGPKFGFPLKATYKQEFTDVDLKVFYPDYGVTVKGDEYVFFSNRDDLNYNQANKYYKISETAIANTAAFKKNAINVFASMDINYYAPISKNASFGIGLYVDYGLPLYQNSPKYEDDKYYKYGVIWINDPTKRGVSTMSREHLSVLDAYNLMARKKDQPMREAAVVKKFNYLSCGIRLSLNFGGVYKAATKHQYKDTKVCRCVFTN